MHTHFTFFRDLQDLRTFAPLQTQHFAKTLTKTRPTLTKNGQCLAYLIETLANCSTTFDRFVNF